MYFAIEENISNVPNMKGTKYICKKGVRYEYGKFEEALGFVSEHKAQLEVNAAIRFWKTAEYKVAGDVWKHYFEEHEI